MWKASPSGRSGPSEARSIRPNTSGSRPISSCSSRERVVRTMTSRSVRAWNVPLPLWENASFNVGAAAARLTSGHRSSDRAACGTAGATRDRPGGLAATAGVMSFHGLALTSASAATWPELELALQCVIAIGPDGRERFDADWDEVGKSLRAALLGTHPVEPDFKPAPPVVVKTTPMEAGRCVVSIEAPDQIGLLWALAHWVES